MAGEASSSSVGMGPAGEAVNGRFLSARLFTKDTALTMGPVSLSLPVEAAVPQLRQILAQTRPSLKVDALDFLLRGEFLRRPVGEEVEERGLGTEATLELEVVRRLPAPQPDLSLPHDDWVSALALGVDGGLLSGSYDGAVRLWDAQGTLAQTLDRGPAAAVKALAWLPQGDAFVAGGNDQTLTLYRRAEGKKDFKAELELRGHERSVEALAVSADGSRLASGGFDTYLKVWDPDASQGDTVLPSDGAKKAKSSLPGKAPMVTLAGHREAVTGVGWMPGDGGCVATASMDQSIVEWDMREAAEKSRLSGPKGHLALAVDPDSGLLLSASADKLVRLWDLRSREGSQVKAAFVGHSGWVTGVSWVSSQLFVSASYDALVKLWDVRSPKAALYDLGGHTDRVLSLHARGRTVASGSVDTTLKTYTLPQP